MSIAADNNSNKPKAGLMPAIKSSLPSECFIVPPYEFCNKKAATKEEHRTKEMVNEIVKYLFCQARLTANSASTALHINCQASCKRACPGQSGL